MNSSARWLMLVLLVLGTFAFAAERVNVINKGSDASPRHWVVLMALPPSDDSVAGHAFVQFGYEDESAQATRFEAWGFYPEGGKQGSWGRVPGAIVDDVKSGSLAAHTILVSVAVTRSEFEKATTVKEAWRIRPPEYHAVTAKNCIDFVDEVAKAVGLKAPNRTLHPTPMRYLGALAALNR